MSKDQALSFLHTVATFSPNKVNLLASKYGYVWPEQNDESRLGFLMALWEDQGEKALMDIALIHPDKELILEASKEAEPLTISISQNADGVESKIDTLIKTLSTKKETSDARPIILVMIVCVLAIILSFKL